MFAVGNALILKELKTDPLPAAYLPKSARPFFSPQLWNYQP
jgi:hypothetical protein